MEDEDIDGDDDDDDEDVLVDTARDRGAAAKSAQDAKGPAAPPICLVCRSVSVIPFS